MFSLFDRRVLGLALVGLVLARGPALAQSRIDQLSTGAAVGGTDSIANCQGCSASVSPLKTTFAQVLTYIQANLSGTIAALTAGNVTTNANLTGPVTSVGNVTAIANGAIGLAKLGGEVDGQCVVGAAGVWGASVCPGGGTGTVTSVGLAPGLAKTVGTRNTGSDAITTTGTANPQIYPVAKAANYTVNADFGGTSDTGALLYATAVGVTFTAPNPAAGTKGNAYQFGSDGTNGNTLATVGATATFYGSTHCTGATTATIPTKVTVQIVDDGTNYQCLEATASAAGSGTVTQNGNLTTHGYVVGGTNGTSDVKTTAAPTNGQIPIGSTGADPVPATITAGANVTVTNGAGSITIAASGGAATVARSHLAGLNLSNDGGTPNSVLDIAAGQAADTTNAVYISIAAFTKSTAGAWTSGTGNNGMGNGLTIANSTWYDVCLANNGGTADIWFDTSNRSTTYAECTNRPSGISDTKYRRIGSFLTNGSAQIVAFSQLGDEFLWKVPPQDANAVTVGTTSVLVSLTVPTGLQVLARVRSEAGNTGTTCTVTSPDETAPASANTPLGNATYALVTNFNFATLDIRTSTSGQIRIICGSAGSTFYEATYGWYDRRGRDN